MTQSIARDYGVLAIVFFTSGYVLYFLSRVAPQAVVKDPEDEELQRARDALKALPALREQVNSSKTRIEELERDKKADAVTIRQLNNKADNLSRDAEAYSSKLAALKWLGVIAERDKSQISQYVYIFFLNVNYEGLNALQPYIEIVFYVINASVYNVTIDKGIKDGAVYLDGEELNPREATIKGSLQNISRDDRSEKRLLVIKQRLTDKEVQRIRNPLPDDKLSFDRLHLEVRGADGDQGVGAQRLSLPSSIPIHATRPRAQAGLDKGAGLGEQLRGVIESDVQDIDRAVRVVNCAVRWDFNVDPPYLEFEFVIFNGSMFPISIDPKVGGHIMYDGTRLVGEKEVPLKRRVINLKPRYHDTLVIHQLLATEQAEMINKDWNAQEYGLFVFDNLEITVMGGDGFQDIIKPKPIMFLWGLSAIHLNGAKL